MTEIIDAKGIALFRQIREDISCPICHNVLNNPMRNTCGHRFCFYCILNSLEPEDNIKNCPKCKATISKPKLLQDKLFGEMVNKITVAYDVVMGGDLSDNSSSSPSKTPGKRRLLQGKYVDDDDYEDDLELAQLTGVSRLQKRLRENEPSSQNSNAVPVNNVESDPAKRSGPSYPAASLAKTSTPAVQTGRPRDLSPFPVSFLNKLGFQANERKNSSPEKDKDNNLGKMRDQLNRKLSFEEDRREHGMSDASSDSEDRRPRASVTYSRFDKVLHSIRKHNSVQTEVSHTGSREVSTQTDGTNSSDLYSSLAQMVKFFCKRSGIQGSLFVEGIGRIEVDLSPVETNSSSKTDQNSDAFKQPITAEAKQVQTTVTGQSNQEGQDKTTNTVNIGTLNVNTQTQESETVSKSTQHSEPSVKSPIPRSFVSEPCNNENVSQTVIESVQSTLAEDELSNQSSVSVTKNSDFGGTRTDLNLTQGDDENDEEEKARPQKGNLSQMLKDLSQQSIEMTEENITNGNQELEDQSEIVTKKTEQTENTEVDMSTELGSQLESRSEIIDNTKDNNGVSQRSQSSSYDKSGESISQNSHIIGSDKDPEETNNDDEDYIMSVLDSLNDGDDLESINDGDSPVKQKSQMKSKDLGNCRKIGQKM